MNKSAKMAAAGIAALALLAAAAAARADPPAAAVHAVAADKPAPNVSWAPELSSIVVPSRNIDLDAWEGFKKFHPKPSLDAHLDDPILHGSLDLHAHFGPDSYARQWDAFEIARTAHERGMRGIVLKNHWSESAGLAWLARKYAGAGDLEIYGGLALDTPEGGVNPQAVRYFAEVEGHYARIVWMPTHDAEHEVRFNKEARPYVVVSRGGKLVPQVLEVLDLIKQYGLTLATGHVSSEEMLQIVAAAQARGITRIIITHPDLGPGFTDASTDQLRRAVAMGGTAEIVASELFGANRQHFVDMIRALGPEHCFVSTDSGLVGTPNHPDAMVKSIRLLREAGFSEHDLDLMFRRNPATLVGLPPLP